MPEPWSYLEGTCSGNCHRPSWPSSYCQHLGSLSTHFWLVYIAKHTLFQYTHRRTNFLVLVAAHKQGCTLYMGLQNLLTTAMHSATMVPLQTHAGVTKTADLSCNLCQLWG